MLKRKQIKKFKNKNGYDKDQKETLIPEDSVDDGDLITSLVSGKDNIHAPVLDIDMTADIYPRPGLEIYPSSQLGHYHLFVNKEMIEKDYFKLLTVLAEVGIIESGYAHASIEAGFSSVRNTGVIKPDIDIAVANILVENAQLKKQMYGLTKYMNKIHNLSNNSILTKAG